MVAVTSHVWVTDSSHPTSDGVVIYQSCACSAHRILLVDAAESSPRLPVAVSVLIAGQTGSLREPG